MGRRLWSLVGLGASLLALLLAAPALAQGGTSTSAGDQQYVDPLANTTPTSATPTPASPSPAASSSSAPTSSTPSSTQSPNPAPSTTAHADPSGTLPYTGLNVGLLVAIGLGLVGAGLLLRRVVRRT